MAEAKSLGEQINEEYIRLSEDPNRGLDTICEMLMDYLPGIIGRHIYMSARQARIEAVDEVLQNTIGDILEKGFTNFSPVKGKFASYCGQIAVNNALNYGKAWYERWGAIDGDEEAADENIADWSTESKIDKVGDTYHSNPENIVIKNEYRILCKEWAEKFINTFVNIDTKPYKLVGSGYSIILSKKYPTNNNKNDLTSPKWALDQLNDCTVQYGADSFISEVNDWTNIKTVNWSPNFDVNMKKEEFGQSIADIVFGEHFDRKSIENWDNSIRKKVKKELIDFECSDKNSLSWE